MNNGRSGRFHLGFVAQDIEEELINAGMTTNDFAGFVRSAGLNDVHEEDVESTRAYLDRSAAKFDQPVQIMVCSGDLIEKVVEFSDQYDLIIMGASLDWGIQEVVTGFRTDRIMEQAKCPVLIIKSYDIFLQRTKVRGFIHRTRNAIHQ